MAVGAHRNFGYQSHVSPALSPTSNRESVCVGTSGVLVAFLMGLFLAHDPAAFWWFQD